MPLVVAAPNAPRSADAAGPATIEIALLNNLGDGGFKGGERQFVDILREAAGPDPVRLRLFSLPGIARGAAARSHIEASYTPYAELMQSRVDGLIVTGCEPRAARLADEPVWGALTEVVDWAEHNTRSTIWSCFAAHAAVLHLDGIERQPLGRKLSGHFSVERAAEHPLLQGVPDPLRVAHSRWNGLDEVALTAAGYEIVTRSDEVGVDLFVKRWRSLFVYLQGHPEYHESALRGEYRRDVMRFLDGTTATYPDLPRHYFSQATEAALSAFEAAAKRDPTTDAAFPLKGRDSGPRRWPRAFAVGLFRNWLRELRTESLDRVA
ncbi:Homoserine O-succinyltransferase [Beijerinckiaceae bacterium RH AL1]|nr:homoserine O-succinyltransferase [Beijerinckiaceae bacterium]VVB48021.1 Homoserine O-succinyltransferase [Beijerinckiaceae bacterium RH CH11]VVB48098.1 Homoserine O-succinyltransferase [Beijerinckiaceae bacterium RH AL8]VVC56182.1 Homoserine O-succinyltransferase [Beijerinckiaceae bacterium RH AL1]